jgi:hypothetical protein
VRPSSTASSSTGCSSIPAIDGLYGRGGAFERVVTGLENLISRYGDEDNAEVVRFPAGMNRALFEKSGYLKSFPQLAGTVHRFDGNERAHTTLLSKLEGGEDWTGDQRVTDIVLAPAACYPLYPAVAKRGPLPKPGLLFDLQSYCFRVANPRKIPHACRCSACTNMSALARRNR